MIGVCLLAWLMFLHHLGARSMWYDEWITWSFAKQPDIWGFVSRYPEGSGHPPLLYAYVWAWVRYTGTQDIFVMRNATTVPALLAVAVAWRVGYDWFRSRWVGLGAALFLATSGIMIYYARELRMYPMVVLLSLGSWWYLRRILDGKGGVLGYGACVGLLAYSYYFAAFMVIVQAFTVIVFRPARLPRLLSAYAIAAVAFAPWLPIFSEQVYLSSIRSLHDGSFTIGNIGLFGTTDPTSFSSFLEFIQRYSAEQPAFVALLVLLAIWLGVSGINSVRYRRHLALLVLWLFMTLTVFFVVNLAIPVYNSRYVLMVLPAIALLVGVAVHQLPARVHLPMLGVIAAVGLFTHEAGFLPLRTPHQQMFETILERYQPGDLIWYNPPIGAMGSLLYDAEPEYYLEYVFPQLNRDMFVWHADTQLQDTAAVRRVWDARPYWVSVPDEAVGPLTEGRVISEQYDIDAYGVRLYEAPPLDQTPVQFGDLFEMLPGGSDRTHYLPGETALIKTWWRRFDPPQRDYSYSLRLYDSSGTLVTTLDNGLVSSDDKPTSQWTPLPDDDYRLAETELPLPADLAAGDYEVRMLLYYWEDPDPLPIQSNGQTLDRADVSVAQIAIEP